MQDSIVRWFDRVGELIAPWGPGPSSGMGTVA